MLGEMQEIWMLNQIKWIDHKINHVSNEKTKITDKKEFNTFVSKRMPHMIWVLYMATLRFSRVPWWYSYVPCEKLKRATFIPALSNFSSIGISLDFGPKVHMIFVFEIRNRDSSFPLPSIPWMSMFAMIFCANLWLALNLTTSWTSLLFNFP